MIWLFPVIVGAFVGIICFIAWVLTPEKMNDYSNYLREKDGRNN